MHPLMLRYGRTEEQARVVPHWTACESFQRGLNQPVVVSGSHIVAGSMVACGMSGLLAKGYHGENGGVVPGAIFWDSVSHRNHQGPVVVATKQMVPSPPSYVIG